MPQGKAMLSINEELAPSTHVMILRNYIERERKMRDFYLKGDRRLRGVQESDQALDSLKCIENMLAGNGGLA